MISYFKGKLVNYISGKAVVDVNGVGYGVWVGEKIKEKIKAEEFLSLFIHTHVREDAIHLYGFHVPEERKVFELMISVSGIGPKLAVNILSGIAAGELIRAVTEEDLKFTFDFMLQYERGIFYTANQFLENVEIQNRENRFSSKRYPCETPGQKSSRRKINKTTHVYQETKHP